MSSRCGIIGSRPGPSSIVGAAALRPPVNRLDAVREEHDAQPQRRRVRPSRPPPPGRTAAATPARAAPARRPRRAGNDAVTADAVSRDRDAHRAPAGRGRSRRLGLRPLRVAGDVVIARAVAELAAGDDLDRQIRERRVGAGRRHLARPAADRRRAPCGPARSRASSSTASSSPACPASAGTSSRPSAPTMVVLSANSPVTSTGLPSAYLSRVRPTASKPSSGKPERIDAQVAVGAGGVALVLGQPLAQRQAVERLVVGRERCRRRPAAAASACRGCAAAPSRRASPGSSAAAPTSSSAPSPGAARRRG